MRSVTHSTFVLLTGFFKVSDVSEAKCMRRNIMLRLLIFVVTNVKGNIGHFSFNLVRCKLDRITASSPLKIGNFDIN
jgi:hypothetical protein